MQFETERLIIRDFKPAEDAQDAFAIYGDAEVVQFLGQQRNPPPDPTVADCESRLQRFVSRALEWEQGFGIWAIETKTDKRVIGTVMLKPIPDGENQPTGDYEVGWHLAKSAWGHGFATEAATACLDLAFDTHKLESVVAVAFAENIRSLRVMDRLGMSPESPTDRYFGVWLNVCRISREKWVSRQRTLVSKKQ